MDKQNTIAIWVLGIVILLIVATQVPLRFPFSIITTTTCVDGVVSSYEFDGNSYDSVGINNAEIINGTFVTGKFGQGILLNGTQDSYIKFPSISYGGIVMWIKDVSLGETDYTFLAKSNGIDYVNAAVSSSKLVIPISSEFGKGRNIVIDRMAVFTNLSEEKIKNLYASGTGKEICWTTQEEVNITCAEYSDRLAEQTGCLRITEPSGIYPNCSFVWENSPNYLFQNNQCAKQKLCLTTCLESENCYNSLSSCSIKIVNTTTSTPSTEESQIITSETVSQGTCLFNVFGLCIQLIHLVLLAIIVAALLYLLLQNQ